MDGLGSQVQLMIRVLFPNTNAVFQDDKAAIQQLEPLTCGFKSIEMNSSAVPEQHDLLYEHHYI
jgi:hypothetical protein